MKVFLNAGHAPSGNPDPGAYGFGLRECDVAKNVADLVVGYLTAAGVEVAGNLQSDSLEEVVDASNGNARGTEVWYYHRSAYREMLADCIRHQIVDALGTTDRGSKGAKPGINGLYVLNNTGATAVLVELAFIDNEQDAQLLRDKQDEFARAIARGITDYEQEVF